MLLYHKIVKKAKLYYTYKKVYNTNNNIFILFYINIVCFHTFQLKNGGSFRRLLLIVLFTPVIVGIGGVIYCCITDYRHRKFLDSTQRELLEDLHDLLVERLDDFDQ